MQSQAGRVMNDTYISQDLCPTVEGSAQEGRDYLSQSKEVKTFIFSPSASILILATEQIEYSGGELETALNGWKEPPGSGEQVLPNRHLPIEIFCVFSSTLAPILSEAWGLSSRHWLTQKIPGVHV